MIKFIELINRKVIVEVDRPLGSKHPKGDMIYLANYGFVPGTISGDGKELDVYILGIHKPIPIGEKFEGIAIALIHRIDDDDDKLVVVPQGVDFTDDQIIALVDFQEKFFKSKIIRG